VGRARTLAQVYRHFGEVDAAGTSPLYERVAVALSESGEALRAIEAAPARKRRPAVILAAHRLDEAATGRAVAWVSAEGVGVAPAIPTLGDRRASGHSIIGLAVFDQSALRAEAIGRCWSRGRLLAWLADP
jgi:Uncharacterized protein conserved in bacteria (DUF2332)